MKFSLSTHFSRPKVRADAKLVCAATNTTIGREPQRGCAEVVADSVKQRVARLATSASVLRTEAALARSRCGARAIAARVGRADPAAATALDEGRAALHLDDLDAVPLGAQRIGLRCGWRAAL